MVVFKVENDNIYLVNDNGEKKQLNNEMYLTASNVLNGLMSKDDYKKLRELEKEVVVLKNQSHAKQEELQSWSLIPYLRDLYDYGNSKIYKRGNQLLINLDFKIRSGTNYYTYFHIPPEVDLSSTFDTHHAFKIDGGDSTAVYIKKDRRIDLTATWRNTRVFTSFIIGI